jgi:hypothetical protein
VAPGWNSEGERLRNDGPVGGARTSEHECAGYNETRWLDGHLKFLTFLNICPLKLGERVLGKVDMGRGGALEVFFDPLSCTVLRFLSDRLELEILNTVRRASLTLSVVRGLMTSTASVSKKACRA